MVQEIELFQFEQLLKQQGNHAVMCYTPFCGTCKVALRMLEVVGHLHSSMSMHRLNVNLHPKWCEAWEIRSVPCLLIFQDGQLLTKEYAVRSVDYLHQLFNDITGKTH
ncbi:thioredoxin family protein [Marinicrinis lubricantis]|uniref:Thioredoxin family protein n=1 Tax=Marinicrinis lubricantis TaxID=2086470 RepID=A0ABW1ITH3_9BACL